MVRNILIGVAVAAVGFLGFVATRADEFKVERSAEIAAPPEIVFAAVSDFHAWAGWSPWDELDPAMKKEYGGAPNGKGATYQWAGNSDVGKGKMEITEATPPSKILIQLDFLEPFEAHNLTEFTFAAAGPKTKVTWSMGGHQGFVEKLFGVFMNMDAMVGKDFEKGLSRLGKVSEAAAAEAKKKAEEAAKARAAAEAAAAAAATAAAPAEGAPPAPAKP